MLVPAPALRLLKDYSHEDFFCLFLSNGHSHSQMHGYDWMCGIGISHSYTDSEAEKLLRQGTGKWIFGHVNFEWNNPHVHPDTERFEKKFFPRISFTEPEMVLAGNGKDLFVLKGNLREPVPRKLQETEMFPSVFPAFPDEENYKASFEEVYRHLLRGDAYELNLCLHAGGRARPDPVALFLELNARSAAPHAVYYKQGDTCCLGASPERFVKKEGQRLETSPIKGTAPRFSNKEEDRSAREKLQHDPKEIKENVMVADLSRNDLSKVASSGSVQVKQLCSIESYAQVHQMVSTICCELPEEKDLLEVWRAVFPMASMTGMPKKKVLEIISRIETAPRNLYSGSIARIDPEGNMDSLVVIRSLLYNLASGEISCSAGSAITDMSRAADEYLECRLKAEAMLRVLANTGLFA